MPLAIVHGMELTPNACLLCGGNPLDFDGNQQRAIFAEGVDVDWGSAVYICCECGELIADLMGRATKEGFDAIAEELGELKIDHEDLLDKYETLNETVEKIREGAAARKKVLAQE